MATFGFSFAPATRQCSIRGIVPIQLAASSKENWVTTSAQRPQLFRNLDVVIHNLDQTPTLLRNLMANGNHWVRLKLIVARKARDASGAKPFPTARGLRQRADAFSGGSYGSSFRFPRIFTVDETKGLLR
jgi:hypothetical protein